jgi:hypothetical protein
MGSFEPLERGDGRLNTRYVNLWFLAQNAFVLRWIHFWYLSRIPEALLFSTSLSPYSFDAYLQLGEMESGHLHRIIWRLFKNIEFEDRLDDVTWVEI